MYKITSSLSMKQFLIGHYFLSVFISQKAERRELYIDNLD